MISMLIKIFSNHNFGKILLILSVSITIVNTKSLANNLNVEEGEFNLIMDEIEINDSRTVYLCQSFKVILKY